VVTQADAALRALHGLLEVATRSLDEDLPGALQEVVDQLAEVLDVRGVGINLHRPEWDDFQVAAIHAPREVQEALKGGTIPRATVETLLDPKFDVGGAFFVPAGAVASDLDGVSAVIPRDDRPDDPNRWDPEDELLVPIRGADGELLGFVSIDEPVSGLRPGPEQIVIAVAVAEAAAAAVRTAQRAIEAARNREALELLFELSAGLTQTEGIEEVLHHCCDGVRRALGFERVAIEVADPLTGDLQMLAAVGWEGGRPAGLGTLRDVELLIDATYEIEGCYLLPSEVALGKLGSYSRRYQSRSNGAGPRAWNDHWLIVPLRDPDGGLVGRLWPDDPTDRLLPSRATLRILRTFANQAMAAMAAAANLDKLQDLARLDDLTGALNRRAFFERLDEELERSRRYAEPVALVICDLDQFKAINDSRGHPAGDDALRRFTQILEQNVRGSDVVGRIGGDEFALILVGGETSDAKGVLDRIRMSLDDAPAAEIGVQASFGTARSPGDGATRDELVAAADARLYDDKRRRAQT
jgi:diguanylate cyclase (GGDEF)-like protein